jgi:Kef-type K+ transport system membrane component KefB
MPSRRGLVLTFAAYFTLLLAAVALFFVIRAQGETLTAPTPEEHTSSAVGRRDDPLLRVLIALVAVIVAGQVLALLLRWLGQPPVIGEVLAGILLGPSLLGQETSRQILPADVAPFLGVIAQIGVILYLFVVGLELDLGMLRGRAHSTLIVSHTSIVVPFVMGCGLSLYLYPLLSSNSVSFTNFALFIGVALSITAFPVLARILTDRGMSKTPMGLTVLTCAATGDATAWCLLAFIVGVARAEVGQSLLVLAWAVGFVVFMLAVVRSLLVRLLPRGENAPVGRGTLGVVFAALLLSALATAAIGIHALFGAFLFGAIIPHDSAVARTLGKQLEDVVLLLLLPAYFAFTGMRTRIDLVSGVEQWLLCALIILTATIGKFGGTFAAARLTGMGWHDSAVLGTLMNTRGLMELIVLNVGLDLQVISPTLFSMMVLMALVTTVATGPVLQFLLAPEQQRKDNSKQEGEPGA